MHEDIVKDCIGLNPLSNQGHSISQDIIDERLEYYGYVLIPLVIRVIQSTKQQIAYCLEASAMS